MTTQEPPKIEFPCADYLVKVVGDADASFKQYVIDTLKRFDPDMDEQKFEERPSSKGTYVSYTFWITATSEAQLSELNTELRKDPRVKTVL